MKNLILFLAIFASFHMVRADQTESKIYSLKKGQTKLYVSEVKLDSVQVLMPKCRQGAACSPSSIAYLSTTLGGCLDWMGPITVKKMQTRSGKTTLFVSAFGIANPESRVAFCARANEVSFTYSLGMGVYSQESISVVNTEPTIISVQ